MLVGLSATAAFYYLQRDKRRRESPVQRALYFWYRAGPIVVHYRFTQWWLNTVVAANNKQHRDQVYETLHNRYCQPCLDIILQLQGLYCKIGQVLSARPDFIPIQYVELFSTVQDSLPPWPASQVKSRVRQALRTERGLELEDVFERIDEECLGSASIGQVHRAVLKSPFDTQKGYKGGNKVVAIKVMSPGAESRFAHDFKVFKWLCRVALPGWKPLLQELERQMMTEFDYLNEAKSLSEIRTNMLKTKYRKCVQIPQPVTNLCCKHLLVMEMLEGKKLAQSIEDKLAAALGGDKQVAQDFLRRKREGESKKLYV
jgi:predicted unusual protein kinase regulating ubiquinone biosynthesis (AarF/ABC1/UbiB family)